MFDSLNSTSENLLQPHLKIAETVTDDEYATAKWQHKMILVSALGLGNLTAVLLTFFVLGALRGMVVGGLVGVGCERLMDRLFPESRKMRTQRMKVFPQLRDYRKRQAGNIG
ncbi:hypothetical protein OAL23_00425 [bacterium]|nr:hypothetical protein [bacterium]